VTPFCSCSAVPAFIGFVAAGVPLGVTIVRKIWPYLLVGIGLGAVIHG
jgi:uncharacterized membrane protein YraQ (UPF0718 family)